MKRQIAKPLSMFILLALVVTPASATKPGEDVNPNGFPSGEHYNLNIIGQKAEFTCPEQELDEFGNPIYGNVVFVPQEERDKVILLKFCWILFVVNAFTIGGGFVMIPMLHKEFVEKYHWLTNQEFLDAIAVGQITPGPLTVMNAFMGYKIHGLLGAILAMISSYLPSIIIVTR